MSRLCRPLIRASCGACLSSLSAMLFQQASKLRDCLFSHSHVCSSCSRWAPATVLEACPKAWSKAPGGGLHQLASNVLAKAATGAVRERPNGMASQATERFTPLREPDAAMAVIQMCMYSL